MTAWHWWLSVASLTWAILTAKIWGRNDGEYRPRRWAVVSALWPVTVIVSFSLNVCIAGGRRLASGGNRLHFWSKSTEERIINGVELWLREPEGNR